MEHERNMACRDVTAGATGATMVAPKFSDTLTLFQPGGGADSAPPSQKSHQKFSRGYISDIIKLKSGYTYKLKSIQYLNHITE